MEEKYPHPKLTFQQWIANFWYYHRWMFIVVSVFVIFALIATVQYFTKEDPDLSILIVGEATVSQKQCDIISKISSERIDDANQDGSYYVDIRTIRLHSNFDLLNEREKVQAMESYQSYSDEILAGDGCILILDDYFYQELAGTGALINLYEVFSEMPESAVDYFGLRLGDTPLYQLDGFSSLPKDSILCLKYASVYSPNSLDKRVEEDVENMRLFRQLYEGR